MAKRSFILFHDYTEQFLCLSDEECGKLIKAIFIYETEGEVTNLPPESRMAFRFIRHALDENRDKYEDICKKRSDAAKKSHFRGNSANASKSKQMHAFAADTETETDTDTVTVTETETVTDTALPKCAKEIRDNTPPTLQKTARGEFHNVFLADEEYAKLVSEYGSEKAKGAVELLSTRIARDNKYKDENHFATIKAWVIRAYEEQNQKKKSPTSEQEKAAKEEKMRALGYDFEFEDIFEKP